MALDFPTGPTVGQKYPVSPTIGQPQYSWDGTKWTTAINPISGGGPVIMANGTVPMGAQLTLFADPVAATDAADKHYVDSAVLGASGGFPSGTVMLFYQAAAPATWTKLTTQNDKALRVVSGSGGVAGGTNAFSTVMAQTVVGNHTLTVAEIPAGITTQGTGSANWYFGANANNYAPTNAGGWSGANYGLLGSGYTIPYTGNGNSPGYTNYAGGSITINATSNNTSGGAHNHGITMAIQYVDVILCSKN